MYPDPMSGTPPLNSYAITEKRRDISEAFTTLMQVDGGILSLIGESQRSFLGLDGKVEWIEDRITYEFDTLNTGGAAVVAADTTMKVSNISRWSVGMIAKFRDYDETFRVTNVNTGASVLTVVRDYNGLGAPTTVANGSTIDIINRPELEGSTGHDNGTFEPSTQYNYLEIFREDLPFTEAVKNTQRYGYSNGDAYIAYNVAKQMRKIKERLNKSVMFGERLIGSMTQRGTMRGIVTWLRQTGSNSTDASAAALTPTMINALLERIYQDDTAAGNVVLFCNTNQARKMAAFNTTLANRLQTVDMMSNQAAGNTRVLEFVADLSKFSGVRIVVDLAAPNKSIMLLNTSKIALVYAPDGKMTTWDYRPEGAHPNAVKKAVYMQATLEMKDHLYSHGIVYNLSA